MKKFFASCSTLDELKREYRRLAMIYHPDCGGSDADMQELNAAYEAAMKDIRFTAQAGTRDAETAEKSADFIRIIDLLLRLHLDVELCGSWLWIGGDTRPVKEQLKSAGCRWAAKKGLWYWHPADAAVSHHRRSSSMSEIREKYGSKVLSGSGSYAVSVS